MAQCFIHFSFISNTIKVADAQVYEFRFRQPTSWLSWLNLILWALEQTL